MIPTGELQWKKGKRLKNCHLLTLHYLAVSANSARKISVRSKSKFWSVLHFHEGKFEKHGSLILFKTFWLFWVSFVKEITTIFFVHSNQSHCTLKTDKSLAKNYSCDLWVIYLCLFSFFTALCQPQWPWRGLSVAPGARSRCECPDKVGQSIITTQSSILWSHVSGEPAYQIWCWSKTLW